MLTYRKAKDTLLNTVNTEYQKKVLERVALVSQELLEEFDPDSPRYWARQEPIKEVLQQLHDEVLPHKDEIIASGKKYPGIPIATEEERLRRWLETVRSDPFLPKPIRDAIVDLLDARISVMSRVFIEEVERYSEALAKGKYWDTLDTNYHWLHNRINDKLYKQGVGVSQIQKEVHGLRDKIQEYYGQFDPRK